MAKKNKKGFNCELWNDRILKENKYFPNREGRKGGPFKADAGSTASCPAQTPLLTAFTGPVPCSSCSPPSVTGVHELPSFSLHCPQMARKCLKAGTQS